VTLNKAKSLLKLKKEGEVPYSSFSKKMIKDLYNDDLIIIKQLNRSQKKIIKKESFDKRYSEDYLIDFIDAKSNLDLMKLNEDTKAKKIENFNFIINGKCLIKLNENIVQLPISSGVYLTVDYFPIIEDNVTIIIVENLKNMKYINYHFIKSENIIYIYRSNTKIKEFLEKYDKNKIYYFGDFDLAGLKIYLSEFYLINKNIEFIIPENIFSLISKFGNEKLFYKQRIYIDFFKKEIYLDFLKNNIKFKELINFIIKEKKVLEQEYFLKIKELKC